MMTERVELNFFFCLHPYETKAEEEVKEKVHFFLLVLYF